MHAAQSFFWNNAASARVRMHGLRVVEGDLVIPNGPWPDGGRAGDALPDVPLATDTPADDEQAGGSAKRRRKDSRDKGDTAQARIERVVEVTAEDVQQGKYCLEEVVLPMPGANVEYPQCLATSGGAAAASAGGDGDAAADARGVQASGADGPGEGVAGESVYDEIARRVGVSLTAEPHSVKEFLVAGLSGDYRRLVTVPRAMRMMFVEYAGLDDEIVGGGVDLVARWNPSLGPGGRATPRGRPHAATQEEGDSLPPPPPLPAQRSGSGGAAATPTDGTDGSGGVGPETGGEAVAMCEGPSGAAEDASEAAAAAATGSGEPDVGGVTDNGGAAAEAEQGSSGSTPQWKLLDDACVVEDGRTVVQCAGGFRAARERDAADAEEAAGRAGEGGRLAVVLTFALPASSYATMLTRELLKASTAAGAHKAASAAAAAAAGVTAARPAEAGDGAAVEAVGRVTAEAASPGDGV